MSTRPSRARSCWRPYARAVATALAVRRTVGRARARDRAGAGARRPARGRRRHRTRAGQPPCQPLASQRPRRTTMMGMSDTVTGAGSPDDPWNLRTPPGTPDYQMYRDDSVGPPELVCQVGSTKLRYLARCLDDVPAMLREHGDWMDLGSADENKPTREGTLEAWPARDQPDRRVVRAPERLPRAVRDVRSVAARTPRPDRVRTRIHRRSTKTRCTRGDTGNASLSARASRCAAVSGGGRPGPAPSSCSRGGATRR